jgi:hypothetical protein
VKSKTRSNRWIEFEVIDTMNLTAERFSKVAENILKFSSTNTASITLPYIEKRMSSYGVLSIASHKGKIIGFGFADSRFMKLGFLKKIPLIHFGLMIVDQEWRGERVSAKLTKAIANSVIKKNRKTWLTGFAVSAKCSSPVSFYRLQQGSLRLGLPKFNKHGELRPLSRSVVGKKISASVSEALNIDVVDDFLVKGVNADSGFHLQQEVYKTNSRFEDDVLHFFNRNVIPDNEVLFVTYVHPILAKVI